VSVSRLSPGRIVGTTNSGLVRRVARGHGASPTRVWVAVTPRTVVVQIGVVGRGLV
jgi:hypothetical protein